MSRPTVPPFGPVIAERRLNPRVAPRRSVVVSLGKPRKTKGSDDWECPFRISGAGMRKIEYGFGVDAFQALTIALEGIRYFLDRMDTPLVWGGMLEDHSGFQRFVPSLNETVVEERHAVRPPSRRGRCRFRFRPTREPPIVYTASGTPVFARVCS